ncbi:LOW QUALITY PROTEIN: uncharacterized protein LOC119615145 [Lucilia sericata]|uniref:LOW QUALITY PROTEIN: uncharacterized protein LOC119615145 n=1 Tax=Lucilia sericata TaxID=13632 RepID=UPI0018A856A2|nr:LOW QUALITY PROTEIN: uncharacterized protein LOC119615145 [Lucilia sericata]
MPPKRDPSNNNNNETPTTSTSNNSTTTAAVLQNSNTAVPAQAAIAINNNSSSCCCCCLRQCFASLIADAAAEQRTIAYQANAKLCRLVRKCPWMYDRNHHNYAKKHILDKSWCKIARECNDSVASCKERWRNIRAAFARSINIYKTHSGPNRVKPYYLHKELSFLVKPMMEGRDKKDEYEDTQDGAGVAGGGGGSAAGSGVKDEETGDEEGAAGDEDDEDEADAEEEEDDYPDETAEIKSAFEALNPDIHIQAETRYQKLLRQNNNNNNQDFEASSIFEPHTEFTTNSDAENEFHFPDDNLSQSETERRVPTHLLQQQQQQQNGVKRPMHLETETFETKRVKLSQLSQAHNENDIRFLEALLPDMAIMNTRQKIVFKRKIYQTLEEVFENSNDFPNIEKIDNKIEQLNHNNSSAHIQAHLNYPSSPISPQTQIRQTVLTVNSTTARNLINNIANLNEAELQKVNGFLQNSLRNHHNQSRLANVSNGPSSAAAKLMSSTPKITITKVTCPPPASLRNLTLTKPPSPSPATVSTTIHNPASAVITSNVHSTTSSLPGKASNTQNGSTANQNNNSPWTQLLPITIKDEIEDVDIV